MTKANKARLAEYNRATATHLSEIYGTYSSAKARGFRWCVEDMEKHNGFALRVFNGNTFKFCLAYQYADQETGEIMLCYHTADNCYRFPIEGEYIAH